MHIFDMLDRSADCIYERSAASDEILLLRHGQHTPHIHPVMEDLVLVIKEHRGNYSFTVRFLLLLHHGIETADGVLLQTGHGSASVQDKCQFCQTFFHFVVSFPSYIMQFL